MLLISLGVSLWRTCSNFCLQRGLIHHTSNGVIRLNRICYYCTYFIFQEDTLVRKWMALRHPSFNFICFVYTVIFKCKSCILPSPLHCGPTGECNRRHPCESFESLLQSYSVQLEKKQGRAHTSCSGPSLTHASMYCFKKWKRSKNTIAT